MILNVFEAFEVPDEGPPVDSEEVYDESAFSDSARVTARRSKRQADVAMRRDHGDPADEILAVADEIDADSIVMSERQRSPAGKVLFGSITRSVLISTERPVTRARCGSDPAITSHVDRYTASVVKPGRKRASYSRPNCRCSAITRWSGTPVNPGR